MKINEATKLLALSFTSNLVKKRKKDSSAYNSDVDAADVDEANFGELEQDYRTVLQTLEETPEIRESIVQSLKDLQANGTDLNDLYPSTEIAESGSLRKILFVGNDGAQNK